MKKKKKAAAKPKSASQSELFKIKRDFIERNYKENINWPVAIKVLNELLELVENTNFWRQFTLKAPYSILWLRGPAGKTYVLSEYARFKKRIIVPIPQNEIPQIDISEEKIGLDYIADDKPKTLKDFLT